MSEETSPQTEKMDETSDQSTDCETNQPVSNAASNRETLDNEHCSKPQTTTTTTTSTKTVSKTTVTSSHPLMNSPDSDLGINTNFENESQMDNFNPGAHSTLNKMSKSVDSNLEGSLDLDLDLPNLESYNEQLPDFPESPTAMKNSLLYDMPLEIQPGNDHSDTENDKSIYEAILSPNLQKVSLTMNEKQGNLNFLAQVKRSNKLRKIKVVPATQTDNSDVSSIDSVSDSIKSEDVYPDNHTTLDLDMNLIKELLDSPDDIDDSVLEPEFPVKDEDRSPREAEPIKEFSAEEERRESRHWQKIVLPSGEQRSIDMRVIEPYKRVLSHGGYLKAGGHNAIIVFSACYLPDKSRKDYVYVMDNLFLYVLQTLDQLVTEDYVLVYLHGSASSNCIPTIGWLKRCYQIIDRRLRKNLKQLYLVHPTFWLKTIIMMTKPFISAKFYRKLHFINSLQELTNCLPLEQAAIPERKLFEESKVYNTFGMVYSTLANRSSRLRLELQTFIRVEYEPFYYLV